MRRSLPLALLLLLFPLVLSSRTPSPSPVPTQNPADALLTALNPADLQTHLTKLLNSPPTSPQAEQLLSLAEQHANNRRTRQALRVLRLSAILGSSEAHAAAASLLFVGDKNVPRDISTATKYLRLSVERGNPDAHALLGFLHASGIADRFGVDKNLHKALLHWIFAAASGNVQAMTALAFQYLHGIGVSRSCDIAAKYYQRAANAIATDPRHWPSAENFLRGKPPLPNTLTDTGRLRLDEGILDGRQQLVNEDADLIHFFRHSAERGDVSAMTTLGGLRLFGGYGLEPDEAAAREMLERAAGLNDGEAHGMLGHLAMRDGLNETALMRFRYSAGSQSRIGHYALGMVFFHGLLGMEQDFSKAAMHFTLATEQKHAEASFHLGVLYWRGMGVDKNYETAFKHFQEGAQLGNIQSMLNVGVILLEGSQPLKKRSCGKAVRYLKKVAEQGEWRTVFDSAFTALDEKEWYRTLYRHLQAAYAGIELAQYNAGMLLERVDGANFPELKHWDRERFLREAHELYEYSGMQGYTDAYIRSANVRYSERKEYAAAARTYAIAAGRNNTEGMVSLALLHARGLGVPENRSAALEYLRKAVKYPEGEPPALIAMTGLRFYWFFTDIYNNIAQMFTKENRLVEKRPVQQAIAPSDVKTTGIFVVSKMEIVEELALVGALFAVLFAVMVVRSKRIARLQAEQQA